MGQEGNLEAKDLELAVPGTYFAGKPIVRINSFSKTLRVLYSKQRPRKCSCFGSDGKEYVFLLKGHEDLRQDERVMQLFSLVNTLLAHDRDTANSHLSIRTYPVIPLSQNSGLIGWVPNCDTLHDLICAYRKSRGIDHRIEQKRMNQFQPQLNNPSQSAQCYDKLAVMQKVTHVASWHCAPVTAVTLVALECYPLLILLTLLPLG